MDVHVHVHLSLSHLLAHCVCVTASDDDLEPYAMSDDPDHTHPTPPRYLRDCLQGDDRCERDGGREGGREREREGGRGG